MVASTDTLAFGLQEDALTFEVAKARSEGAPIVISASADVPWIVIQSCQAGDAVCTSSGPNDAILISVSANRGKMGLGMNTGTVTLTSPGIVPLSIEVSAETNVAPDFSVSTRTPYEGEAVRFEDISEVAPGWTISSWLWDFGDGPASPAQIPAPHVFKTYGPHTVSLTITAVQTLTGATVTLTHTKEDFLIVLDKEPPLASFEILNTTAIAGNAVSFVDTSVAQSAPITAWHWDFGDGSTSTEQDPSHVYTDPGTYTVSLTVTTAHGQDTAVRENAVTITSISPQAAFRVSDLTPDINRSIRFFDESVPGTAPITAWRWEFGDGSISTEQNPTHIYTYQGTFTIRLTVTTAHGSDTETRPAYVRASVAGPDADFSARRTGVSVLDVVRFEDSSAPGSYDVTYWLWRFGDGTISYEPNPVHQYHTPGTYDVSLTVRTQQMEDSVTRTGYVTVTAATDLDEYVRRDDGAFVVSPSQRLSRLQYRIRSLYITSQVWAPQGRTPESWDHKISVIVPTNRTSDTALLFVREGIVSDVLGTATVEQQMLDLALTSGSVVAILYQMPDRGSAVAHELAAESLAQYLITGDSDWPLLMPMTKSIVKAMDAVTTYLDEGNEGDVDVNGFVVAGGDLNGWAAWLAAAVDSRVEAVLPMAWNMVNMSAVAAYIEDFYHVYPEAWAPYTTRGVLQALTTPQGAMLEGLIDPHTYRARLKLPMLIVSSANDEFFPPGTERVFLDDLPEIPRHLYVPNVDHYFDPTPGTPPDAVTGYRDTLVEALPWFMAVANDQPLPEFSTAIVAGQIEGLFTITTAQPASVARVWSATAGQSDFRLGAAERTAWSAGASLERLQNAFYEARVSTSRGTALGAYVELTYPSDVSSGGRPVPFRFDTPMIVVGTE
jgi:PKD repeat protein